MTGPLLTGQHITYAIWAFTAFSVAVQWRYRNQPHAETCRNIAQRATAPVAVEHVAAAAPPEGAHTGWTATARLPRG